MYRKNKQIQHITYQLHPLRCDAECLSIMAVNFRSDNLRKIINWLTDRLLIWNGLKRINHKYVESVSDNDHRRNTCFMLKLLSENILSNTLIYVNKSFHMLISNILNSHFKWICIKVHITSMFVGYQSHTHKWNGALHYYTNRYRLIELGL